MTVAKGYSKTYTTTATVLTTVLITPRQHAPSYATTAPAASVRNQIPIQPGHHPYRGQAQSIGQRPLPSCRKNRHFHPRKQDILHVQLSQPSHISNQAKDSKQPGKPSGKEASNSQPHLIRASPVRPACPFQSSASSSQGKRHKVYPSRKTDISSKDSISNAAGYLQSITPRPTLPQRNVRRPSRQGQENK